MKQKQANYSEADKALEFYAEITRAMKASGIRKIVVTVNRDGRLEADIIEKSALTGADSKDRSMRNEK